MDAVEWRVTLAVTSANHQAEMPRSSAEEILFGTVVRHAEALGLGVGGGLREDTPGRWVIEFGLCATRAGQTIAYDHASELVEAVRQAYAGTGVTIRGSVQPFPAFGKETGGTVG